MDKDWNLIRRHIKKSLFSSWHVAIASVGSDHVPTVTPIGTFFLNKNEMTGFYFEKFTSTLPRHAKTNENICVLAVNSGFWFWVKSLFQLQFKSYPAVKLYGKMGIRRKATDKELKRLWRRLQPLRRLKGADYLWSDMKYIREISFTRVEKMNFGKMTKDL